MKVLCNGAAADVPSGCTWLVPGVSVGNAGQQAIDLLLQTLQASKAAEGPATKIGSVVSQHVRALASSNVFQGDKCEIHTEMELYHVPAANLLVLQQRSRCHEGFEEAWSAELAEFAKASKAAGLVVLAGAQAFLNSDAAISAAKGPEVRPLLFEGFPVTGSDDSPAAAEETSSDVGSSSSGSALLLAGKRVFGDAFSSISAGDASASYDERFAALKTTVAAAFAELQGCGLAARHARRAAAAGVPVLVIPITLNEGLNAPEALILAHVSQALLGILRDETGQTVPPPQVPWTEPPSWKIPEGPAPPPMFFLGSR